MSKNNEKEQNTEKNKSDIDVQNREELNQKSENNDIEYEIDEDFIEESGLNDKLKKLRNQLKDEKQKSQEYLTGWQTERASFANYKTQEEKSRNERKKSMKLDFISDLFPVLDSFDMAFSNRKAWEAVEPAWRTGVEYIHTQFMNVLEQNNVQLINQLNVPFNPTLHEPADTIPTDNKSQDNTVASIIQTGYMSDNMVIRPAKVKIYQFGEK